jgi:hypothetical protein
MRKPKTERPPKTERQETRYRNPLRIAWMRKWPELLLERVEADENTAVEAHWRFTSNGKLIGTWTEAGSPGMARRLKALLRVLENSRNRAMYFAENELGRHQKASEGGSAQRDTDKSAKIRQLADAALRRGENPSYYVDEWYRAHALEKDTIRKAIAKVRKTHRT